MEQFKQHIASGCHTELPTELLNLIIERYEWFTVARVVRKHSTSEEDSRMDVATIGRHLPILAHRDIDLEKLLATPLAEDLIDKFLQLDNYRIIADEGEASVSDAEIRTEAELDDEDDIVSEELAEVYLAQGLKSEAIAIYRKLSLLNPKKSIYFAELIKQIEKQ